MAEILESEPLPRYQAPPVVEVALGVYFRPIPLSAAHLGLLWGRWKSRYPKVEEQPGLPPAQPETFGPLEAPTLNVILGPGMTRVWYRSDPASGSLVQVQSDRVVHNWQRGDDPTRPYPHYREIRPEFVRDLTDFRSFLESENLGDMLASVVEVSYTNVIDLPDNAGADLSRVLRPWRGAEPPLPREEDANFNMRFRIPGPDGAPVGRLHVSAAPGLRPGSPDASKKSIILQMFARGAPIGGNGVDGALNFMDIGHDLIVKAFDAITTPEMHRIWLKEES